MSFGKGFRTIAFNVLMTAIAILAIINPVAELPDPAQVAKLVEDFGIWFASAWGIGNALLRAITDSPIFKKAPPEVAS